MLGQFGTEVLPIPQVVDDYNDYMCGIVIADQLI